MAHIDHTRSVRTVGQVRLEEFLPWDAPGESFAAFCGAPSQRAAVGLRAIARCCGRFGVVLLHDDPAFEGSLSTLGLRFPQVRQASFHIRPANRPGDGGPYYDLLYGLPEEEVVRCVAPYRDGLSHAGQAEVQARLLDYLAICACRFRQDPTPFGEYPYNLDLLLDLAAMPYDRLDRAVLSHLPEPLRTRLRGSLSAPGVQQRVYDALTAFAVRVGGALWARRNAQNHTGLSLISAVRRRDLISVRVPGSRSEALDYLDLELQALIRQQVPFLVVACGLTLTGSTLRERFLGEHGSLHYATGLLAETASGVLGDQNEGMDRLMGQHHKVLVFACSSRESAEPFSAAFGSYYRQVRESHTDRRREPFRFLSSHGSGTSLRETAERNIRGEELMGLGAGALLCGRAVDTPVLARRVD